jgi:hypothetical protein
MKEERIQNFCGEISWKRATWSIENEKRGHHDMYLSGK